MFRQLQELQHIRRKKTGEQIDVQKKSTIKTVDFFVFPDSALIPLWRF